MCLVSILSFCEMNQFCESARCWNSFSFSFYWTIFQYGTPNSTFRSLRSRRVEFEKQNTVSTSTFATISLLALAFTRRYRQNSAQRSYSSRGRQQMLRRICTDSYSWSWEGIFGICSICTRGHGEENTFLTHKIWMAPEFRKFDTGSPAAQCSYIPGSLV